jgi:hypothetical protein
MPTVKLALTTKNTNDDDILTQGSVSSKSETFTINPNVCLSFKNLQNLPGMANVRITDIANHTPAKENNPNTQKAKPTNNLKEHNDWLALLNHASATNQPPMAYGPTINMQTPAS